MAKIKYSLILIALLFCSLVFADTPQNLRTKLKDYVDHWRLANSIPAMAVTLSQPQTGTITVVSGAKEEGGNKLLAETNSFQIGSITKTFITAAILQLEAQGKLSIASKIGTWFPQYPHWQNITIQQLLNMSSGIFQYENDPQFMEISKTKPAKSWDPMDLIALSYQHPLYFQPGQGWHYANVNYLLAGKIIEQATHQPLTVVIQGLIQSQKLQHTFYVPTIIPAQRLQQVAHGYHDNEDITFHDMSAFGAAGAMFSTSQDIATWVKALFAEQVFPRKQLDEFMTTTPFTAPPKPQGSRYGLGVYYLHSQQYGDIWWYSGVTRGYISLFIYLPQSKTIVTSTIDRIHGDNYWPLMPDRPFVTGLLRVINKSPTLCRVQK